MRERVILDMGPGRLTVPPNSEPPSTNSCTLSYIKWKKPKDQYNINKQKTPPRLYNKIYILKISIQVSPRISLWICSGGYILLSDTL